MLIDYGSDQDAALRRIVNARATFQKLGNIEFQAITMEGEAANSLHAGRHQAARQQLHAALSLANDHQLGARVVYASIRLAQSYFETAEYQLARALLEKTAATSSGRDELAVPIVLGRVYARLGDVDGARQRLTQALKAVEASGQLWLAPSAHTALGELEYEWGNTREARSHFDEAAAYWTDDLPDAASVEARCYRDALDAHLATASATIAASVQQARRMGRLYLEAQCRLQQARLYLSRRQPADALATVNEIPLDGERTVGKEMQAQAHYWRSRAMRASGNRSGAEAEAAEARNLVNELQTSLPPPSRDRFAARAQIRQMLEGDAIEARR